MLRRRERKDQGIRQLGVSSRSSSSVATVFFCHRVKLLKVGRVGTTAMLVCRIQTWVSWVTPRHHWKSRVLGGGHFWGKLFGLHHTPKKVINENITGSNMDMSKPSKPINLDGSWISLWWFQILYVSCSTFFSHLMTIPNDHDVTSGFKTYITQHDRPIGSLLVPRTTK